MYSLELADIEAVPRGMAKETRDVQTQPSSKRSIFFRTDSENMAPNFQTSNESGSIVSKSKAFASKSKMVNKNSSESVQRYNTPVNIDDDDFTDIECGEVIQLRRVVIDFTPTKEDDARLEKCYAFWNFVNNNRELDKFLTKPTPFEKISTGTNTENSDSDSTSVAKK